MHLFALNLEKLTKISLSASTHSFHLAFDKWVHYAFSFRVYIIDQEVSVCLLDIVDLTREHKRVLQILESCGRHGKRVSTLARLFVCDIAVPVINLFLHCFVFGLISINNPALVTIKTSTHTEAPSLADTFRIKFSKTVLDIDTLLSWMSANLIQDACECLSPKIDFQY